MEFFPKFELPEDKRIKHINKYIHFLFLSCTFGLNSAVNFPGLFDENPFLIAAIALERPVPICWSFFLIASFATDHFDVLGPDAKFVFLRKNFRFSKKTNFENSQGGVTRGSGGCLSVEVVVVGEESPSIFA
jgi:hypothetical protein